MALIDPGKFNNDLYTRFRTRYNRNPNADEEQKFKDYAAQHKVDLTKPIEQNIYDAGMSYVDSLGPAFTPPPPAPPPATPPPGNAGGNPGPPVAPTPPAPDFNWDETPAPTPNLPDKFDYDPFEAPDAEGMFADPGYQFRFKEGQRALVNAKAAKNAIRSGETLQALTDYGQGMASQEYGNVFGRALTTYNTNRNNAADVWDREFDWEMAASAPDLLTWQRDNRRGELDFDRQWQEHVYGRDDYWRGNEFETRRWQLMNDDNFRRMVFSSDDEFRRAVQKESEAWKREVMIEERLRWLANQGR